MENEEFYREDKEEYNIMTNTKLIKWLLHEMKEGYDYTIDIKDLQRIVDSLADWYETKYPTVLCTKGNIHGIDDMSKNMNVDSYLCRLTETQQNLLSCPYHAKDMRIFEKKHEGLKDKYIEFQLKKGFNSITLDADVNHGFIAEWSIKDLADWNISIPYMTDINELYIAFTHIGKDMEYKDLERIVKDHEIDLKLRNELLNLVSLKLIYSKKDSIEYGYKRSLCFIKEFNDYYYNISLNSDKIDALVNEKPVKHNKIKTLINNLLN